jgi:hypothetical protein
MKTLISILVGIAAFVGVFIGVNYIISFLLSGIQNQDLRVIMRIVCWIFGFGATLFIGIFAGYMTGSITDILLKDKPRKDGQRTNH